MNKKIITILVIIIAVLAVLLLIYAVNPAILKGSLVGGKKRVDVGGERELIIPGLGKKKVDIMDEIGKKKGVGVMDEIGKKKGVGVMDEIGKKKMEGWTGGAEEWKK